MEHIIDISHVLLQAIALAAQVAQHGGKLVEGIIGCVRLCRLRLSFADPKNYLYESDANH